MTYQFLLEIYIHIYIISMFMFEFAFKSMLNLFCNVNILSLLCYFFVFSDRFWTLDVSRAAAYEITAILPPVCLPITKFFQDWIISFF